MGAKLLFRLKLGLGLWLADAKQRDAGHNPDANLKMRQGFGSARRPTASGSAMVVASCPPKSSHLPG